MAERGNETQRRRREREGALQVLPDMLNRILVQTGKVFRDPAGYSHKDGARGTPMAQIVLGIEGFHAALDALEIELLQAKAALLQDLADFRAKEAETQKRSNAVVQTEVSVPPASTQAIAETAAPKIEIKHIEHARKDNDPITITIEDDEPEGIPQTAGRNLTKPMEEDILRFSPMMSSPPPPTPEVMEIPNPGKSGGAINVQQPERQTGGTSISQPPFQDEMSASTAPNEMDFDSMFPDITADPGGSNLDLNLSFAADSHLDHGSLVGQGLNMSSAALKDPTTTANEEMDALLPGLGSYASAVDDVGTIGVPVSTATNPAATSPNKANIDLSGPTISNEPTRLDVDDLFADSENFILGDHGLDGDVTGSAFDIGAGGEFDNAFFGMDGS
ncbi:MAG: hypothetical protein M1816_004787 [Peltula sp. TS41687]|nr:MAG: hypothetical protein M1816_004787 [Peltula sp. TS41687]